MLIKLCELVFPVAFIILLVCCSMSPSSPSSGSSSSSGDTNISALINSVPEFSLSTPATNISTNTNIGCSTNTTTNGTAIADTLWVTNAVNYSLSADPSTFVLFNPLASVLWPGDLVQGNSLSAVPNPVPVTNRAPMTVTLAIVGGGSNTYSRTVIPTLASINQAENDILASYGGGTPANISFSVSQVYNASSLNFMLGGAYSGGTYSLAAQFNIDWSAVSQVVVVKLSQNFFTMAVTPPQGIGGCFGPGTTVAEISPYTGPGNPMCHIDSVTYGRLFYLIYTTSSTSLNLADAIGFGYNGGVVTGSVTNNTQFNSAMSNVNVQFYAMGGDSSLGFSVAQAKSISGILSILGNNVTFSSNNVGVPVSYTVRYLKDNSLVAMNSTTSYTVNQATPYSLGNSYTMSGFEVQFVSTYATDGWLNGDFLCHLRLVTNGVLLPNQATGATGNMDYWVDGWYSDKQTKDVSSPFQTTVYLRNDGNDTLSFLASFMDYAGGDAPTVEYDFKYDATRQAWYCDKDGGLAIVPNAPLNVGIKASWSGFAGVIDGFSFNCSITPQ